MAIATDDPATSSHGTTVPSSEADDRTEHFDRVAASTPATIGNESATAPEANSDDPQQVEVEGNDADTEFAKAQTTLPELSEETAGFYLQFLAYEVAKFTKDKRFYLSDDDMKEINPFFQPVAAKWIPRLMVGPLENFKEEIAFCLVMFGVFGPRFVSFNERAITAGTPTPPSSGNRDAARAT